MLGAAITSALNEAAEMVPDLDVDGWTGVLTEVLAPERVRRAGEVIEIETLRLIKAGRKAPPN
jgi:hypothetical protein